MKKPKVFVTLPRKWYNTYVCVEAQEKISSFATVVVNEKDRILSEEEVSDMIKYVDGIITGWKGGKLTKENIEIAKNLKIIGVIGSSVKKISPDAAFSRNITMVNTAKAIGDSVAEFALGFILDGLHNISWANEKLKKGKDWFEVKGPRMCFDLTNKTVGLIGVGVVARRLIELLKPFEARILFYDPYLSEDTKNKLGIERASLWKVMAEARVISIHAGLSKETYHMIGEKELSLIQEDAVLINTARGDIINEKALIKKLKEGKLRAALDVYSEEPLPMESEIRKLESVTLTSHLGANPNADVFRKIGLAVVGDFGLFFSGKKPENIVTEEKLKIMT